MIFRIVGVLLIAVLLATLGLVGSVTWFLWHERATAEATLRDAHVVILEVGLTAKNLREASKVWKQASQDQASAVTSAMQNVNVVAKQLSQSASALEKSSTALLNELTRDANEQNAQLLVNQRQLQKNLEGIQAATGELRQTLQTANAQIGNPAIAETLQHLDEASDNAAQGLGEVTKAVTDVRQIADKARETYLRPVNLWWALTQKILGIGPPIVTAIK